VRERLRWRSCRLAVDAILTVIAGLVKNMTASQQTR
jgi:hypothetical protein